MLAIEVPAPSSKVCSAQSGGRGIGRFFPSTVSLANAFEKPIQADNKGGLESHQSRNCMAIG